MMDLESTLLLMNNPENNIILQDLPVVDCVTDVHVTPQYLLLNDPVSTEDTSADSLLILKDVSSSETTSNKKNELQTVNLLNSFNYIGSVSQPTSQECVSGTPIQVFDIIDTCPQQEVLTSTAPAQATRSEPKTKKNAKKRNRLAEGGVLKGIRRKNASGRVNRAKMRVATSVDTSEQPLPSNLSLPVISDSTEDKVVRTGIVTKSSNDPPTLSVPDEENVISVTSNGCTKRRLTQEELRQIGLLLEKKKTFRRNEGVKKVICRVVYPDDVNDSVLNSANNPKKIKKKVERPQKAAEFPATETASPGRGETLVTRSGRVSKRPRNYEGVMKILLNSSKNKHNFRDYLNNDRVQEEPLATQEKSSEPPPSDSKVPQLLRGLDRVRRKKCNLSVCPTCNKSFTSISMWRHVNKYPWHVDTETFNQIQNNHSQSQAPIKRQLSRLSVYNRLDRKSELKNLIRYCKKEDLIATAAPKFTSSISTWQFLLLKMKHGRNPSSHNTIQAFFKELKEVAEEAANWSAKLFSKEEKTGKTVNIEDDTLSKIIGIEKGVYQLNEGELQKLVTPNTPLIDDVDLERNDSNELLQDMMLLDKSTMDTVDQLVNERLKSLAPGPDDLIAPPGASSHHSIHHMNNDDDLMSNLLMTAVSDVVPSSCEDISATADDLLKSLETLGPPTLDFTALSNEYNPVR